MSNRVSSIFAHREKSTKKTTPTVYHPLDELNTKVGINLSDFSSSNLFVKNKIYNISNTPRMQYITKNDPCSSLQIKIFRETTSAKLKTWCFEHLITKRNNTVKSTFFHYNLSKIGNISCRRIGIVNCKIKELVIVDE